MAGRETGVTFVIRSESKVDEGLKQAQSQFDQFKSSLDDLLGGKLSSIGKLLQNPFTIGATAIATAGKALKELTDEGMRGQDQFLKFSAMLGSKSEASSLIGQISALSDISFESKESIEQLSLKLIGAGYSAEQINDILTATVDISNTSGRSISEVGNALHNAFLGKTEEIDKILPSLKTLGEDAWETGDALQHIGESLHEASLNIASGSLSNQLGAIGNSWDEIKKNLGTTIVTTISSTGVLQTIATWLDKIEEHTRRSADRAMAREEIDLLDKYKNTSDYQMLLEGGLVTPETIEMLLEQSDIAKATHTTYGLLTKDKYNQYKTALDRYYELHPVVETTEATGTPTETPTVTDTSADKWWTEYDKFMSHRDMVWSEGALSEEMSWFDRIISGEWEGVTSKDWDSYLSLILRCPDGSTKDTLLNTYAKDRRAYELWSNITPTVETVELNIGANPWGEGNKPYEASSIGNRTFDWNLGGYVSEQSRKSTENILNAQWDKVTDEDWNELAETIAMFPEGDVKDTATELFAQQRNVYETYLWMQKNGSYQSTSFGGYVFDWRSGEWTGNDVKLNWGEKPQYTAQGLFNSYMGGELSYEDLVSIYTSNNIDMSNYMKEISDNEQKKADQHFKEVTDGIKNVISTLDSLTGIWKDGYQTGDISNSLTAIGGALGGKWGTILSLIGMGGSLLTSWFGDEDEDVTTASDSTQSQIARYTGSTVIRANFYISDNNIYGTGGAEGFAQMIRNELENLQNLNR